MFFLFVASIQGCTRPLGPIVETDFRFVPQDIEKVITEELKMINKDKSGPQIIDLAEKAARQGRAAAESSDINRALLNLELALRLSPERVDDRLFLIDLLLKQNMTSAAGHHIDSLPSPLENEQTVIDRALLLLRAKKTWEAKALILEFLEDKEPESTTIREIWAATECMLERPEAAHVLLGKEYSDAEGHRTCELLLNKKEFF